MLHRMQLLFHTCSPHRPRYLPQDGILLYSLPIKRHRSPLGGHKETITHDQPSLTRPSLPRSTKSSLCTSPPDMPALYHREDYDNDDNVEMPTLIPRQKSKSYLSCNSLPIKSPTAKHVTFKTPPCPRNLLPPRPQNLMPPRPPTQPSSQSEPASTLPQKAPDVRCNRANPHPKSLQGYIHASTILGKSPTLPRDHSPTQSIPAIQTKTKPKGKYHRTHDSTVKP